MKNTKNYTRKRLNYTRIISCAIIGIIIFAVSTISACGDGVQRANVIPNIEIKQQQSPGANDQKQTGMPGGQIITYVPKGFSSLNPLKASSKELMNSLALVYENFIKYDNENKLAPSIAESWEKFDENAEKEKQLQDQQQIDQDQTQQEQIFIPEEPEPILQEIPISEILPDEGQIEPEASQEAEQEMTTEIINSKKWKISIRKDVFWHNTNEPLRASDVIYTIGLLKTPEYADSVYSHNIDEIVTVEIVDDYTIIVEAKSSGTAVLNALTFPVVSRKYFELQKKPVGTGPYKMIYANKNVGIEFAANENWWKQPPFIKSIIARAQKDNSSAILKIRERELNFVPTMDITAGTNKETGRTSTMDLKTQQMETLLLNHSNYLISEPSVRQAIAYAIDKRDIISKAYLSRASATDVPVAPDSWLYNVSANTYDYNVETAKTILAAAGWQDINDDGFLNKNDDGVLKVLQFNLLVNDTTENQIRKDVAQLIKTQLEEIGIKINIVYSKWDEKSNDFEKDIQSGNFDLALAGFNVGRGYDLSSFLSKEGSTNFSRYFDEKMEQALEKTTNAQTDKQLRESISNVQKIFVEQVPFVSLYFRTSSIVYDEAIVLTNDIRETDPFYSVEKWYFKAPKRNEMKIKTLGDDVRWAEFDAP